MRLILLLIWASFFFYNFPTYPCERCDEIEEFLQKEINYLVENLYEYEVSDFYMQDHAIIMIKLDTFYKFHRKFFSERQM